jgi:adenylosuccinate lyase
MIKRYTLPEMGAVWSEESKLNNWLKIEVAACEAWAQLGRIPIGSVETIKSRASFDVDRIAEIEAEVRHDVIAFLTNVGEYVGDDSKYIHLGLTSSDILDTGIAMQMRDSADIILTKLEKLQEVIKAKLCNTNIPCASDVLMESMASYHIWLENGLMVYGNGQKY